MTKVTIEPGVCGFRAKVVAVADEDKESVVIKVVTGCKAVAGMMQQLGEEFDAYELCLAKPGANPLYEYASAAFPAHAACPTIAGIIKCAEAECGLALKRNAAIVFED
ncbi:MAG: hypothetical protein IKM51_04500 [Oscillospiraceae bacterium]|nr:hypothetical protein [Oscillospiraceae bacterium]